MKTKDLPKIAASQLADSDCLLADCAALGTGLVPFAVFSDYHIKRTGVWPSNPNLLINADFRQPANRNGKSEYTVSGWTIDKWASSVTLTLQDDYLKISTTASHNAYANFSQSMKGKQFNSKTVTVSILYRNTSQHQGEMTIYNASQNQWKANVYLPVSSDWSLAKITKKFKNTDFGNNDKLAVNVRPSIAGQQLAGSIDIKAIKLELGSVQTLAHQDADGNWVLNDPPNYALQYALCSQYSPSTGEFVGSQHSNPNLLDNWYFADPINQRGQTKYTGSGFGIDRWQMTYANCTLGEKGLTINGQNNYGRLSQQVEQKRIIVGEQYTFSVLVTDIAEGSANITMTTNYGAAKNLVVGLNSITFVANANSYAAIVPFNNSTGTATILAVKLELGPVQTLAHKEGDVWVLNDPPPAKSVELAKCQRYYNSYRNKTNQEVTLSRNFYAANTEPHFINGTIALPTTMRAKPTLTKANIVAQAFDESAQNADISSAQFTVVNITNNLLNLNIYTSDIAWPKGVPIALKLAPNGYLGFSSDL